VTRLIISSALITIAIGACSAADPGQQPAPGSVQNPSETARIAAGLEGQNWSVAGDLFGYFLPQDDVSIGDIQLDHISLAAQWEAEAFMRGEADAFPPISLHFDDTSSPTGIGELGNTYYEVTYRVQPDVFAVSDTGLQFTGRHDLLGEVRFAGTWNPEQIAQMMAGNPQNAPAALTGDLRLGDVVFRDVAFQGWLGD
jgi:hypothetical protein